MCGRAYSTITEEELEMRYSWERLKRDPLGLKSNYNLSPTQMAPIVFERDGKIAIEMMRWGLVPLWAKDVKSAAKYSLINARGEEITEKRSYAAAFKQRRCIVPLSGFFEWKRDGEQKRPFAIHLKNNEIMSIAGVFERWESKENGEIVDSFSIVTTSANTFMEKIHDRMPVILDKKHESAWLSTDTTVADAQQLLKPCPSTWLAAHEVSTAVNSPKNNRKEILEPVGG